VAPIASLSTSTVLVGCRNTDAGEEAIRQLKKDGVTATLHTVALDIEDDTSIATVMETVGEKFGKLDGE